MSETYRPYSEFVAETNEAMAAGENPNLAERALSVSRRGFLGAAALIAAAGAAIKVDGEVEGLVADMHWQSGQTEIIPLNHTTPRARKGIGTVSASGLNGTHGLEIATRLINAGVYRLDDPSVTNAYYLYGGRSLTLRSLGACTQKFADNLELREMDMIGNSEGGMLSMMGALAAGRHLRIVTTNDSPFDVDDARSAWYAKKIAWAHDKLGFEGNISSEFMSYMGQEVIQQGFRDFKNEMRFAWSQTWGKLPPEVVVDEDVLLNEIKLNDYLSDFRRRDIVTSSTHFILSHTVQTDTDHIVKDTQALKKWINFAEDLGASHEEPEIPVAGHAPIGPGISVAAPYMLRAIGGNRVV